MTPEDDPTCDCTYATFLVQHRDLDPESITRRLGLEPSLTLRRGESTSLNPRKHRPAPIGTWGFSSEGHVDSTDSREHLKWLLEWLVPRAEAISGYHASGYDAYVSCFWLSKQGHGGPTLTVEIMGHLAALGLELWYDFYPIDED